MPAQPGVIRSNKDRFAKHLRDKFYLDVLKTRKRKGKTIGLFHNELKYVDNPPRTIERFNANTLAGEYRGTDGFEGVYLHADESTAFYDALFMKSGIDSRYRIIEASLMRKKWFDYRFMHFMEATYLFSRYYSKAHGEMMAKIFDHKKGPYMRGFTGADFMMIGEKHRAGLIKARRAADALGIPYWFYNDFAMKWTVEGNIWKRPPKPTQLYQKEMLPDLVAAWQERLQATIITPIDERYLLTSEMDGENQREFRIWLCEQIKSRNNPELALNNFLNKTPMITRNDAIQYIGEKYLEKVDRIHIT